MDQKKLLSKAGVKLGQKICQRTFLCKGALAFLLFLPVLARADDIDSTRNILRFFQQFRAILDLLLPIVVTLAVLVFFWGMVKFIWSGADERARDDGKGLMVWGIIALFVMISVWGLVELFANLFGVNQSATITVPSVPSNAGGGVDLI